MAVNTSTRLGCGRDIDDVWEKIDEPPDAHERTCPDCRNARASLTRLAELTRAQRDQDRDDPDFQPSPRVLERIMDIARAEVRHGRRLPLDEPAPHRPVADLTVSEQALAAVVRQAGDALPAVEVRRVRIVVPHPRPWLQPDPESDPGSDAGSDADAESDPGSGLEPEPARVVLSLQISVAASAAIPVVSRELREAVRAAVRSEVGMNPVTVDITVQDVHDE